MTSFFLRFFEGKFPFSSGKSGKLERVKLDLLENRSKSYTFLRNDDRITLRSFLIKIHRPLSSVSSPFLDIQDQFQTDGTLDSFTNNQLTRGYSTVVVLSGGVHRGQMEIFRKFPNYFRSNPFDSISGLLPLLFNSPITFFRSFSKIYPYFIRLWVITPFKILDDRITFVRCGNFFNRRLFQTRFEESIAFSSFLSQTIVYHVIFACPPSVFLNYENHGQMERTNEMVVAIREGKEKIGGTHVRNGVTLLNFFRFFPRRNVSENCTTAACARTCRGNKVKVLNQRSVAWRFATIRGKLSSFFSFFHHYHDY